MQNEHVAPMTTMLHNKKCIVFGANGYLGRHLAHFLAQAGCSVSAFDMHDKPSSPEGSYRSIDICNVEALREIDWNVDYVFFFAGITGTHKGFDDYQHYILVNEVGLLNVLTCLRHSGYRPRLLFPSTRLVYAGSDVPLREEDRKNPKTIYAANKISGENILELYRNAFALPFTVYRICVPYGNILGADYSYGTVGALLTQARRDRCVTLYGDGSLRRTFTHVEDICRQIIGTCGDDGSLNETFNIAGEAFTLKEVATRIAEKHCAAVRYAEWPENDWKIESGHTVFNADKLMNRYHIPLVHSLPAWIDRPEP